MSKLRIYTTDEQKELRVVAKSPRDTWKVQLEPLAVRFQRGYAALYAKVNDLAKELGLPSTGPSSSIGRANFKKDGTPRKSYTFRKPEERKKHDPPFKKKSLSVRADEIRFDVKGLTFQTSEGVLQLVVKI